MIHDLNARYSLGQVIVRTGTQAAQIVNKVGENRLANKVCHVLNLQILAAQVLHVLSQDDLVHIELDLRLVELQAINPWP